MKLVKNHRPAMMDVFNPAFVNRFFNEVMAGNDAAPFQEEADFRPGAEIRKTETAYEVLLALPGISREEVTISLDGDVLTVKGERKRGMNEQQGQLLRSEIRYGKFVRSFTLNNEIDKNGIDATFKDGMLSIVLPVSEKAMPRTVEIKG